MIMTFARPMRCAHTALRKPLFAMQIRGFSRIDGMLAFFYEKKFKNAILIGIIRVKEYPFHALRGVVCIHRDLSKVS